MENFGRRSLGIAGKDPVRNGGLVASRLDRCGFARRSPVARLFLGSVSLELIHKATCSVRVTRAREAFPRSGPIRLIVGTDGSTEADSVINAVSARLLAE